MPSKLKVYRTAIGFHDAYVAAASQKAALAAWGTDKPLFARGAAEIVTDPALIEEPLASPGKVIRRPRGTAEEQVAALPPDKAKGAKKAAARKRRSPKPSRAELGAAEQAIGDAEARHRAQLQELEEREKALREERRALQGDYAGELERLATVRDAAAETYQAALDRWQG